MGLIRILLLFGLAASVTCKTVRLYVSPTGLDTNSGLDAKSPLQTLQRAKERLDEPDIKGNTVIVELQRGYHILNSTLHFSQDYSHPVTFTSEPGQEVHVTGGKQIAGSKFQKVTDQNTLQILPQTARSKVLQVHLPDIGITDYGQITEFGFYRPKTSWLELFINGNPTRLAQYPNEGYIDITSVSDRQATVFTHGSHEDSRWTHEKEPWALGYWYWSWADDAVKIKSIDAKHHQITLDKKPHYGLRIGHYNDHDLKGFLEQGGYFRVFNMLSELDQPGEYYIDRSTGILYVWPNTPHGTLTDKDVIYASMLTDCIKIDKYVKNLHFEDFTLEACRRSGFDINSGRDLGFKNLEIKNTGYYGINCYGDCRSVSVSRCDIHHTCGGVAIAGGVRKTLTPSLNVVEDNHIWQYARVGSVGYNAISPSGVAINMRYNHIHDGQYTGIRWDGNDHVMEYNHLHHLCVNSSDCGALHAGRDWTMRGVHIRHNHIHHTLRKVPGAQVRGVMLDDEYSSVTIEHNVFYDNEVHANIGGGRDNIIRYNVFYNATGDSIQVDGRGMDSEHSAQLRINLQAVPYQNSLWASRYPKLANMKNNSFPMGNEIYDNIFYNKRGIEQIHYTGGNKIMKTEYFNVTNNHHSVFTTDFISPENGDFKLECAAIDWANGISFPQPLTLPEVGPRYPTGPTYTHTRRASTQARFVLGPDVTTKTPHYSAANCTGTAAPATKTPRTPYFSDGSGPNTVYPNIPKEGCWLNTSGCPRHSASGLHRDRYGEAYEGTGASEEKCLARAAKQWTYCGSPDDGTVTAVFGPTGAMTIAGKHCYFADYGCPKHGGTDAGRLEVDRYGESQGGLTDETKCLDRAVGQYWWCGADPDHPFTSIYGPTGATRHAGGGCWIKMASCPADKTLPVFFYDARGATNKGTDQDESECLARADVFWNKCGAHRDKPVTAIYRPAAKSRTVP